MRLYYEKKIKDEVENPTQNQYIKFFTHEKILEDLKWELQNFDTWLREEYSSYMIFSM